MDHSECRIMQRQRNPSLQRQWDSTKIVLHSASLHKNFLLFLKEELQERTTVLCTPGFTNAVLCISVISLAIYMGCNE